MTGSWGWLWIVKLCVPVYKERAGIWALSVPAPGSVHSPWECQSTWECPQSVRAPRTIPVSVNVTAPAPRGCLWGWSSALSSVWLQVWNSLLILCGNRSDICTVIVALLRSFPDILIYAFFSADKYSILVYKSLKLAKGTTIIFWYKLGLQIAGRL